MKVELFVLILIQIPIYLRADENNNLSMIDDEGLQMFDNQPDGGAILRSNPLHPKDVIEDPRQSREDSSGRFLFPLRKFFGFNEFEGRGIKDFIGIVSTILAALLGAILVKLNALIVLSMVSIGIGKLLLLFTAFKSQHGFHNNWQQSPPIIISEKIRQPAYYHEEYSHHPTGHILRNDENVVYAYP